MDIINMYLSVDTMRLIIRLILIGLVIGVIWWFFARRSKYEYGGLQKYKRDYTFLEKIVNGFKKKPKRSKVNKTEEMCRKILEQIYGRKFPSVRPDFLKSPMTHKNLELDCFCQELMIALEYNGQQHYRYTPHFHKSKTNFYSQVHRDDWKRKRCREMGIRLIEVPYWVSPIDLKDYIMNELRKKGCL